MQDGHDVARATRWGGPPSGGPSPCVALSLVPIDVGTGYHLPSWSAHLGGGSTMPVKPRCPACGNAQGRVQNVSAVPGRNDSVLVDLSCESCSHAWGTELPILPVRTTQSPSNPHALPERPSPDCMALVPELLKLAEQ